MVCKEYETHSWCHLFNELKLILLKNIVELLLMSTLVFCYVHRGIWKKWSYPSCIWYVFERRSCLDNDDCDDVRIIRVIRDNLTLLNINHQILSFLDWSENLKFLSFSASEIFRTLVFLFFILLTEIVSWLSAPVIKVICFGAKCGNSLL